MLHLRPSWEVLGEKKKGGGVRRVKVSGVDLWDSPKISYGGVFVFG